ncbi:Auxin efflux carrier component 8 [Linum perenne]
MISGQDFYHVLSALVPLYVAMGLAYASVRWWKIFTPDQCAGINRFVAVFAVPFLSFTFVSSNNFYHMNYRFIAADSLQKAGFLLLLILICNSPFFPSRRLRRIDCVITLFSLSTLPNTLVVGVPLLAAMYGDFTSPLMVQIVVLQSVFWYTILLIMFEYRAAVQFIADQFPVSGTAARISSEMDDDYDESKKGAPKGVMGRLVMIMVWKKLIRNPNTYASLLGIFWSLLSFSLNLELPSIVENSVSILANTGLGMAMFSLGLFIGVQPKVIGCGKWMALMAMSARFLLGPGVAAAAAGVVGVRGILLQVTIVQAALPQGIIPFVYAKDYNLYPEILSTAVIFGMVVALPVTIIYYVLLGL